MNGSVRYTGCRQNTRCSICGNRVPLETSKTDERGSAVHEECYVGRTVALLAQQRAERSVQITRPLLQQQIGRVFFTVY